MVLQPLQQSQFLKSGKIVLSDQFNMDEVVAWKNGQFIFNRMNVENIMRQIGRWYDIEVVYNNKNNTETFSGIVSKRSNLSEVLKIMEEGGVKFKIEGKKITVY